MPTAVCKTCGYRLPGTRTARNRVEWKYQGVEYMALCKFRDDPDPDLRKKVREYECPRLWEAMTEAQNSSR